ncbi:hypothetical protein H6789_02030 [Candidatus Nomurabacteria bacterium]|nr:hypothetical protein [Candidatus Nomurabacteria bacterium]
MDILSLKLPYSISRLLLVVSMTVGFFAIASLASAQSCYISASPSSLPYGGGSVYLSWNSYGAVGASVWALSPNQMISSSLSGGTSWYNGGSSRTYKVDVWNAYGQVGACYASVSIQPPPSPPSCSLSVSPTTIPYGGGSVTASYSSSNAVGGTLHPGSINAGTYGSRSVSLSSAGYVQYDVWNSSGQSTTCYKYVTMQPQPQPPSATFTSDITSVPYGGGNVTFSFSNAQNHNGVTLHVGGQQYVMYGSSGSKTVFINGNTTAQLDVWRNDGAITKYYRNITVQAAAPPSGTLSSSPVKLAEAGGAMTFNWSASNHDGVTLHVPGQTERVLYGASGQSTYNFLRYQPQQSPVTIQLDIWRLDGSLKTIYYPLEITSGTGQLHAPQNLTASCSYYSPTQSIVSFDWNNVTGASSYWFRLDKEPTSFDAQSAGCFSVNPALSAAGDYCTEGLTNSGINYLVTNNTEYDWWVHSVSDSGGVSSAAISNFSCGEAINQGDGFRPKNLTATCNAEGTQATLSWTDQYNTNNYPLRVDMNPSSWNRTGNCDGTWQNGDFCTDSQSSKSRTIPVQPNTLYEWWVHSIKDGEASASSLSSFQCTPQIVPEEENLPSLTLTASPSTVASGGSSTLTWTTANVTSCTASGAWSGSKTASGGSQNVSNITSNSTYTLTCTGPNGSVSRTATVTVSGAVAEEGEGNEPSLTFTANPTEVGPNGSSTLSWTTANVTSCTASGGTGWSGSKAFGGGSQVVSGIVSSTTYFLVCNGPGGQTPIRSATVNVNDSLGAGVPPELSANPVYIHRGRTVQFTFDLNGNDRSGCTLTGPRGYSSSLPESGNTMTSPVISGESSFTLSCPGGSDEAIVYTLPVFQET